MLLKKWLKIEKKPIEAKLLYKATNDGFTRANFISKVNGKGNLLLLIKSSEGFRFGGFRNIPYNKSLS